MTQYNEHSASPSTLGATAHSSLAGSPPPHRLYANKCYQIDPEPHRPCKCHIKCGTLVEKILLLDSS